MNSLTVKNLTKKYPNKTKQQFTAVNDLSFEVAEGEVVAFLGPNGAGKSTTIKMLCGILSPTSGSANIFDQTAGSLKANRLLGLVFGTRSQLHLHMTIKESLELCAEIYFVTGKQKHVRIEYLADLFQIKQHLSARARNLSLGERMRCELVAALIHNPRVLLADEPTIGLDIVAKNKLRELVRTWQREEKTTVLLTSHDLSDVEALCNRCILIDHGEKQYDGSLDGLKGDLKNIRRLVITVQDSQIPQFCHPRIASRASDSPYQHTYEVNILELNINETVGLLLAYYGDKLQDIQINEVELEEVLHSRFGR